MFFKRKKKKQKTFILGVGCQKGGTTWLFRQLKRTPKVDMGFCKEYHIFDGLYCKDITNIKEQREKQHAQLDHNSTLTPEELQLSQLISFYKDTNNYFNYFDHLVQSTPKTEIVGDITPSYSGLPKEAFVHIKEQLQSRGFKIKVVFLMRDPIERIWSQVRMGRRRRLKENSNCIFNISEEESVSKLYLSSNCQLRTRYENIIDNLESVFAPEEIFYGIFEEFFTEESMLSLQNFFEFSLKNPKIEKKVNTTKRSETLSLETEKNIAQFYKKTYKVCDEKFNINKLWKGFAHI